MSVLFVNDTPDHQEEHAHFYDEGREQVVAVSFVADNGISVRVSFEPSSGLIRCAMYGEGGEEMETAG